MKREISLIFTIKIIVGFTCAQSDFGYSPQARGGHYIYNGRYQNQAQQQPTNLYQISPAAYYNQQPQQSSNNVIGNTAENTYGNSAVNSIINPRFNDGSSVNSIVNPASGSSNNVIGNKAYNTHGASVNSVLNSPIYNLPGLSAAYNNPYGAEWTSRVLQNAFGNLG